MRLAAVIALALAACSPASADAPTDRGEAPLDLDDLARGKRFRLTGFRQLPPYPVGATVWGPSANVPALLVLTPPPEIPFEFAIARDDSWPGRRLGAHPHFAIPREFEGGVTSWAALCDARGRSRSGDANVLAYLGTWCEMRHDRSRIDGLVALMASPRLAPAIRDDVADYLTEDRSVAQALAWLDSRNLRTPDVLDALATSYAANEQPTEARDLLVHLLDRDPGAAPDVACRRIQRAAMLADGVTVAELERRMLETPSTHPVCARLAAPLRCRRDLERIGNLAPSCGGTLAADIELDVARACGMIAADRPSALPALRLLALRQRWPRGTVGTCHWQEAAALAARSLVVPGAERLALVALENAMVDSPCDGGTLGAIARIADAIRRDPAHDRANDERIASIAATTPGTCRRHFERARRRTGH